MNSKILTIAAAATILVSACDNWTPPVSPEGKVDLSSVAISNDDAVKIIGSDHVGRAEDVDLSSYVVRVYSAGDASTPLYTWTYATMPEVLTIPAASYRIDVESHAVAKAEWEKPYFAGASEDFTVEAGKITKVGDIVCSFKNIRVSVNYDEDVLPILGDDVTITVKANDEGSLVFTPTETRSGYFQYVQSSTTMAVTFKGTLAGSPVESTFTFADLAPGQHRVITIHRKLNPTPPDQTGTINPGVGIDLGVTTEDVDGNITLEEEVQSLEVPWPEDPDNPEPGPDDPVKEEAAEFTSSNLDLKGVNIPADKTGGASVLITCPKGIENLHVTIKSEKLVPTLAEFNLKENFDLAHPGDMASALEDLQLPYGDAVLHKTDVLFDITTFMALLVFEDTYIFELKVVDVEGNESNLTLTFKDN